MYIAFKNRHQLKDETKCKAWLLTILRRLYLKEIRQNINRPVTVEDISGVPLMEAQIANDHTLIFEKEEKAVIVRRCLSEFPENYQTPTLLYFMDDIGQLAIIDHESHLGRACNKGIPTDLAVWGKKNIGLP